MRTQLITLQQNLRLFDFRVTSPGCMQGAKLKRTVQQIGIGSAQASTVAELIAIR